MKQLVAVFFSALVGVTCHTPAFAQTTEVRTVPLVVMTSSGQVVRGLTAQRIRVRGLKTAVQTVSLDSGPRHIILLFDTSGSMDEGGHYLKKWKNAKDTARALLKCLPAQDLVAMDAFAGKETQLVRFTHDFTSISRTIDALSKPHHETNAGDALNSALRDAGSELGFGASVVFFSDGEFYDDQSRRSIRSMLPELERRGIRVLLALATVSDLPRRTDLADETQFLGLRDASDFVAATGGFSFAPGNFPRFSPPLQISTIGSFEQRIAILRNVIQETYRVNLQLDEPLRKKRTFKLEVTDGKGGTLHDLFLRYARNLYPN